ncbi:glycosyltransferase [Ramlibacter sp.]|uniref:glycosyltransferase n=1 Tax=Ramlibacter sp. TaxID=1917967 RepID=UPI002C2F3DF1|nr:glycosyltransferase [Ramlibacter sp.]HWI84632.1 glycosyltransferase [Ramlibacter sp.]
MMRTAFVVLTYNRSDALLAVLRGLAPQCRPDDVVVVADDGSREEHVAALRRDLPRFACPVRHVWHPDIGFTAARARNLGALHAQADYIVFLDGDCVPTGHFRRAHLALAQPGHFVNGSRVLLGERLSRQVLQDGVDLARLPAGGWLRLRWRGDVNKLTHLVCWTAAPGRVQTAFAWRGIRSCNFGVWYRDLEAVNGFDETFSGWGHEDADLVLRLHHHGLHRKNGFLATEVFHLWHREHDRAGEAANRERVQQRLRQRLVRAQAGLAELGPADATVLDLNK